MARSGSGREAAIRSEGGALYIRVWAHPGSDRDSIDGIDEFRKALIVRVKARAVGGEANSGILTLVSEMLGCDVFLEAGTTSRLKVIRSFTDLTPDEAEGKLLGGKFQ